MNKSDLINAVAEKANLPHKRAEEVVNLVFDSMVDAMIDEGDIVVMKQEPEWRNGDMVAVWLEDKEETTLKHIYREGNRIRLQPANPTMAPIYIDDPRNLRVQGKVMLVVRQLH